MTNEQQAAPGWYPDPHQPARLRYWDGEIWTEHYHAGDGSLPAIGKWLGSIFSAIGAYGIPLFGLSVGVSLAINIVTLVGFRWMAGNNAIVDQSFVGDLSPLAVKGAVLIVIVVLCQILLWLVLNRYMQRAHLQAEPTIADAFAQGLARLPRLLGAVVLLFVVFVLWFVVFVVVASLGAWPVTALLALASIPAGIWFCIKMAFVTQAAAAAPTGTGVFRASAGVSTGRFWAVIGRVVLLAVMVMFVSSALSGALGSIAQPFNQNLVEEILVSTDGPGETLTVTGFAFADLLPGVGQSIAFLIVSSILNGLTSLVSTSGMMRLYLDSGAPSQV